ncbi:uncharacterized protein LOC130664783 [Microplitis mediator]|uniref:uncharacterized protein LOC130664783 n=1 Tax=Microplitis mediator TaxID=375433 RepID=UPI002555C5B0|nr:uncharacterized protein LOC130664783 [Microplitis mediator]
MSLLKMCDKLPSDLERYECFRKECFSKIYDYNALSIIKTRFPKLSVRNYYTVKYSSLVASKFYEDILKSYNLWQYYVNLRSVPDQMISKLSSSDQNYICTAVFGKYIALATDSKINIYTLNSQNFTLKNYHSFNLIMNMKVTELKFGYLDDGKKKCLCLIATSTARFMMAWDVEKKKALTLNGSEDHLCPGTARNFYMSWNLIINKYKIESGVMKVESTVKLSDLKKDGKKLVLSDIDDLKTEPANLGKIVALDSSEMDIFALVCRVEKGQLVLKRFVFEDILLICTEGGLLYDRINTYVPLPETFKEEKTKFYLTVDDYVICTCGHNLAIYDAVINDWVVHEVFDEQKYVETLMIHANLLLLGFNTGEIYAYDVSVPQYMVKKNFFNPTLDSEYRYTINLNAGRIIAFNVFEHEMTIDEKRHFFPFLLITTEKNTYLLKFTDTN